MRSKNTLFSTLLLVGLALTHLACSASKGAGIKPVSWPIGTPVFTTAEHQVLPVAIPKDTPPINPKEVAKYAQYGYSAWQLGAALPHEKRTELAPAYKGAAAVARLVSFFAITDIHITDKESPAQPINPGYSAVYGPTSAGLFVSSYSPIILSTTQLLDATIQTMNALHKKTPFDFAISLGDDTNNSQYNELRWFIDVMDGKLITPSSGAHAGASTIDYQQPFQAAGLDKSIPWYQVVGNHDQRWSGVMRENEKTMKAHVGTDILNIKFSFTDPDFLNKTGAYMGVVDGTTPYGDIIGAGPQENFSSPPKVVADGNRRTLATDESTTKNWMGEFLTTSSNPVGHGFTQAALARDFASYTFEPKSDVPLKVIALDDTCKNNAMPVNSMMYYGSGCLDQARLDWLKAELQKGQDEGKLMIIAAHIPIKPQAELGDKKPVNMFFDKAAEESLLATLHTYPNLILWAAGHRHLNVVTALPFNKDDPNDHPENSFWEVETASLRDFPQQARTFDIRRNSDNTISIFVTDVDPAVAEGTPAAKSRGYAIGAMRIFGATPTQLADTTSHAYNAELIKQLTPQMQAKIAQAGTALK